MVIRIDNFWLNICYRCYSALRGDEEDDMAKP